MFLDLELCRLSRFFGRLFLQTSDFFYKRSLNPIYDSGGFDVVQTWIWFGVSVVYVALGIFNYLSARRLHDANIPSAKRNAIAYPDGERERLRELDIQVMAKVASQPDAQSRINDLKWGHFFLNLDGVLENLNNSFDYFDRFVAEFNDATKINRRVLKLAAASFIVAAVISFAQGLGYI
jgi:hypothetical protein